MYDKIILISPLEWGLGHATRLCPIISELKKRNRIIIASDNSSLKFLKEEFPSLEFVKLSSIRIKYSKYSNFMAFKMFFSVPKIIFGIIKEHFQVKKIIKQYDINVIISDNRFGLWNKGIYSIFITHQITVQMNKILKFMEYPLYLLNKFFINKYDECWVPDCKYENNNISGNLSHKYQAHKNTKYIGILSRFTNKEITNKKITNFKLRITNGDTCKFLKNKYEVVAIISGPEPQKTIFYELILEQLKSTNYRALIISGNLSKIINKKNKNIRIVNHLSTIEMYLVLKNSDFIISRAGYSSIMDYISLKKSAILIPTPGQTEQEYLANYLSSKKMFLFVEQNKLNINRDISNFKTHKINFEKNINKLMINYKL